MARSWSLSRQIGSERPREPLTDRCAVHRGQRTSILHGLVSGWHCLACHGCPRCGARQVWEQVEPDDGGLCADPIVLDGHPPIRGDWWCLRCGEWLVLWQEYRRRLRAWRAAVRALTEPGQRWTERAPNGQFTTTTGDGGEAA